MKNIKLYLKLGGKTFTAKTNNKGKATFKMSKFYKNGTFTAKIQFKGNNLYNSVSLSKKITIKKDKVKLIAKNKKFKRRTKVKKYVVTLKNNKGALMKNVKLCLKFGGKTFTAKTNSKGKATFKIRKFYKKGKMTAIVKYNGNKYYYSASISKKITIKS